LTGVTITLTDETEFSLGQADNRSVLCPALQTSTDARLVVRIAKGQDRIEDDPQERQPKTKSGALAKVLGNVQGDDDAEQGP
jgi:hypothetical protein